MWEQLKWWQPQNQSKRTRLEQLARLNIPGKNVYKALEETEYERVKVVILGQDPYPSARYATGLAFSVPKDIKVWPASLENIITEYRSDLHMPRPGSGDLTPWARRGVLLWNTCLSVRPQQPRSHRGLGWEDLTNEVLDVLCARRSPPVFILWGMDARTVFGSREAQKITSVHPSPLSARKGFFGSRPFSSANILLNKMGVEPIDWRL